MLGAYHRRLQVVVDRLLARANEVDQDQEFLPEHSGAEASKRLGKVCSDLVVLTDSLNLIDEQIKARDVRGSKESLLQCCRVASHSARELDAVRAVLITADS